MGKMGRPSLFDEVNVQELEDMRNIEGLSNSEIAERLDVSTETVRRYIGAGNIRRARRSKPEEIVEEPTFAGLLLSTHMESYIASRHKKMVLTNGRVLDILLMEEEGDSPIMVGLSRNDVETLVEELKSILTMMKE